MCGKLFILFARQAFVALEVIGGTIRGSVSSGGEVVAIQSTRTVNDGNWHKIR